MTDVSITAANVVKGSNAVFERGTAGATITAGKVVYKDSTTHKYGLADSNSVTSGIRRPVSIALNGASDGQPLATLTAGDLTIGGTLVPGTSYYLSDTPGGICPMADVASGEDVVFIGIAKSATVLAVDIQISGVTL